MYLHTSHTVSPPKSLLHIHISFVPMTIYSTHNVTLNSCNNEASVLGGGEI